MFPHCVFRFVVLQFAPAPRAWLECVAGREKVPPASLGELKKWGDFGNRCENRISVNVWISTRRYSSLTNDFNDSNDSDGS